MDFKKYPENWSNIIALVKTRDNFTCSKCKKIFTSYELRVHHMIPLSKGGSNSESNLQTLCGNCHKLKHPHMKNSKFKIQKKDYSKKYSKNNSRISESDMLME